MENKQPQTIFTDQDHAMASAIRQVFPNACHQLCEWHIHENATQNIPHLYSKPEFKKKFVKCFRGCETEEEFEYVWKEMIEEWNAMDNSWLCKLYDIRKKWCPVFSNDFFLANMKSTQRSESTNNVFHLMSCKTLTLTEFVQHYEENAKKMREAENNEDFRCIYGKPRVCIPSGILMHAADVYTCKLFTMFQEEFVKGVAEQVIEHIHDGVIDCYKLKKENSQKVLTVWFDTSTVSISCSCKKFETLGLLCSHILRILNVNNNDNRIPAKYILKRWTKGAKETDIGGRSISSLKSNVKESKTMVFSRIMHKASKVMNLASFDGKAVKMFEELIDEAFERIKRYKENLSHSNNFDTHFAESSQIAT